MPKRPIAIEILPASAAASLEMLGAHLRIARERRGESLKAMAERVGTSIPTLRRMEAGDPKVSVGIYVGALWIFGRAAALESVLAPEADSYAIMLDVDRASRKRSK